MTMMRQILADRQLAIETRMLKHDAEPPPHRAGFARQVVTEHTRTSRLNRHERREQLEQSGFAAAVGSQEAEYLAACDRKSHVAERLAIAVAKAERARFDRAGFAANRVVGGARWIRNCGNTHVARMRLRSYGSPSPPAGRVPCSDSPISARCHPSWNAVVRSSPRPCPDAWPMKSSPVSW